MEILLQIIGVAYFLFALWDLRLAVLLLPLFFPAYLLKFDLGGVPFPLVEVLIYVTFFAWILKTGRDLFQHKILWKDVTAPFKNSWWLAVLGIVVAGIISTFIAPQSVLMMDGNTIFYGRKVALGILKSWIVAPVLMLMLFAWVMKTGKDLKIAVESYVLSAVFLAVWGIYQVLTKQYSTPDMRASGPFNSANYLALFVTPALFYAFVRVKEFFVATQEPWWKKIFHMVIPRKHQEHPQFLIMLIWIAAFVFLFFGLLFTKSYAAFLAFFIVCVLWFAFQIKDWKKIPWKIVLVFVGMIFLIFISLIMLDPTKWQVFFELTARTSSGVRVEIYQIALKLLLDHPIFGIGLGMFPAFSQLQGPAILGRPLFESNMLHPHDVFLAFWLNLGLLGFLSFLWILKVCFQKAWKHLKNSAHQSLQTPQYFHAVGFLMLVIILVHGIVDTPFFKNDLALLFWLVVALIIFPSGKHGQE